MTSAAVTGSPTHALLATTRVDVRLRLSALAARCATGHRCISTGARCQQAHVVLLEDHDHGDGQLVQLVFDAPVCAMATASLPAIQRPPTRWAASCSIRTRHSGGDAVLHGSHGWSTGATGAGAGIAHCCSSPLRSCTWPRCSYCRRRRPDRSAGAQRVITREDTVVILASHWQLLREQVVTSLRSWHERRPDDPVSTASAAQHPAALAASLWNALLQDLLDDGSVQRVGAWWPARP